MDRISPTAILSEKACRFRAARSRAGETPSDPDTWDAGEVGTVVHGALAALAPTDAGPGDAEDAVRRRGASPAVLEDAAPLVAAGLRVLRERALSVEAVEKQVEVDCGDGFLAEGFADLVASNPRECHAEVWDWKTSAALPPSTEDLRNDPQVATYLCWLRAAYPDASEWVGRWVYLRHGPRVVTVRYQPGMEQWLVAEVRRAIRARTLPVEKSPATPGKHCAYCPYRSNCDAVLSWLGADKPGPESLERADVRALALLYDQWRDREKVSKSLKETIRARLEVLMGEEKRLAPEGAKVTRVDQTRESWHPTVVSELAALGGEDERVIWDRCGLVNDKKVDLELAKLPAEKRSLLDEYREVRTSSHLRVSVK